MRKSAFVGVYQLLMRCMSPETNKSDDVLCRLL